MHLCCLVGYHSLPAKSFFVAYTSVWVAVGRHLIVSEVIFRDVHQLYPVMYLLYLLLWMHLSMCVY